MRVVHDPEGQPRTLAREVERADSALAQARGLMFRSSIPDEYALVFPFGDAGWRFIHMLFVRFPIDVLWLDDGEVRRVETMHPWRSFGGATADTVLELPAGSADGVEPGDRVVVEE